MQLYRSWRESPNVPRGWTPRDPPGAVVKVKIKNKGLLQPLQAAKPWRWYKVYHYGKDGSSNPLLSALLG
jgi:hypothetical protein